MKTSKQSKNLKVFIRSRPLLGTQIGDSTCINIINDKQLMVSSSHTKEVTEKDKFSFTFDKVFQPEASQSQIYEHVSQNIVSNIFEGINGTIFCYGQTSSGKTYTCLGGDYFQQTKRGIVPRIIEDILNKIEISPKHLECKMKMSIVQIYNEKIRDLLDISKNDLKIRENKSQGIFINGVTEKYILTTHDSNAYILKGIQNRAVGTTNMNISSSRSHMMITLTIQQHNLYTGQAKASKLILIDLAGCQKISKTGAEGKLLQQAKKINTSLSVLGKVIKNLSQGKSSHIPYRDSKLTRLLQESLGGNCITNLVINISPAQKNEHETMLSLRFGYRAKTIKNKPKINKQYTVTELQDLLCKAEKKIKEQTQIIADLLKNDSSLLKQNKSIYKFIKDYEQQKQRQKQLKEFQSQLGSQDGIKRIKDNYLSPQSYFFKDLSQNQEQQSEIKEKNGLFCFGKNSNKQTNSVVRLFSASYENSPKLKKSESLLNVNKSFQGHDIIKKSRRCPSSDLNGTLNGTLNEEQIKQKSLIQLKQKPIKLPLLISNFAQLSEDESENEETQRKKYCNKTDNDQIKISNISGRSSNRSSDNIGQQNTRIELKNFELRQWNKIYSIDIQPIKNHSTRNNSPRSRQQESDKAEKSTSDKTNPQGTYFIHRQDEKFSIREQGHCHKVQNQRFLTAFQNLNKIRANMRIMSKIGRKNTTLKC